MIHVIFHKNVDDVIFYLILFYFCSFLYLRLVQPFKANIINISYEATELLQINFLFFYKFFVQAVNLKNSDIALTLGTYMIYSIIAIIIMNLSSIVLTFIFIFSGTIIDFLKTRNRKNSLISLIKEKKNSKPKDSNAISLHLFSKEHLKRDANEKTIKEPTQINSKVTFS